MAMHWLSSCSAPWGAALKTARRARAALYGILDLYTGFTLIRYLYTVVQVHWLAPLPEMFKTNQNGPALVEYSSFAALKTA